VSDKTLEELLPTEEEADAIAAEQLDQLADRPLGQDVADKLRRLYELRTERDETKTAADAAEKDYRDYEAELWDQLDESPFEGQLKINLGEPYGIVGFQPKLQRFHRLTDKKKAIASLKQLGEHEAIIEEKLSGERLNAFVRERMDANQGLPPGIDFRPKRSIAISQQKD
jgi:hypothetical protein